MSQQPRKRNRLSLSCNYCKKRKVKCDRGRPCSSCVKYNVADFCDYSFFAKKQYESDPNHNDTKIEKPGSRPTFAIKNSNGDKSDNAGILTELEILKARIKQLETNYDPNHKNDGDIYNDKQKPEVHPDGILENTKEVSNTNKSPNSHERSISPSASGTGPGLNPGHGSTFARPGSFSFQTSNPFQGFSPSKNSLTPNFQANIQLPPINWSPIPESSSTANPINSSNFPNSHSNSINTSTTPRKLSSTYPVASGLGPSPAPTDFKSPNSTEHSPSYVVSPCTYARNQKKVYLAVNPYEEPNEIINFHRGCEPCYIRDTVIRSHNGIFTWLSFIRKDSGLRRLWDYLVDPTNKDTTNQKLLSARKRGFNTNYKDVINKVVSAKNNQISTNGSSPAEVSERNLLSTFKDRMMDNKNYEQAASDEMEETFRERVLENATCPDLKPYKEIADKNGKISANIFDTNSIKNINNHALSLGLTVADSKISKELELADKIILLLPTKKAIWTLINKFFTNVYPYMPYFDESSFKLEITRIVGPEDYLDSKIEKLNVDNRLDFAYIGIMLLMLRFTYLSLFSNKQALNQYNLNNDSMDPKAVTLRYLLSNPISIQVVEAAQLCVDQFDLFKKTGFPVLQLAYTLRLYHMFGPEEGDGADGASPLISNGMVVLVAHNMAVNREPEQITYEERDEKFNNMSRKLWFFIVITDLIQGYQYGEPLTVDSKYFDTRLPFYRKGNENIADTQMEKDVISTFAYFDKFYGKVKNVLDVTLDVKAENKAIDLFTLVSDIERFVDNTYGTLEEYMIPFSEEYYSYPFIKTMKCKTFINLNGFISSLLMHIYYYYESKNNVKLAVYYLKKVIITQCLTMVPYYNEFFGRNHINFGEGSDLILNPSFINSIHKNNQMNISLLVKINAVIHRLKSKESHVNDLTDYKYQLRFQKYCKLSRVIQKVIKYGIATLSRLSNRYYIAWRITKAHNFLLNLLIGNDYYNDTDNENLVEFTQLIELEDIDEFLTIYEQTLRAIEERKIKISTEFGKQGNFHPGTKSGTTNTSVVNDFISPQQENFKMPKSSVLDGQEPRRITKDVSTTNLYNSDVLNGNPPEINYTQNHQNFDTPNVFGGNNTDRNKSEHDYTPNTSGSDNDYHEMVNNKDIDNLWFQLTNGENKLNHDFGEFGSIWDASSSQDFNDIFTAVESFTDFMKES